MKKLALLFVVFCFFLKPHAQEVSPILFIYDASGSMWGKLEDRTKKEIAADVLAETVGNLPENQNVGLLAYGHRKKGDCDDIEYLVDLKNHSKVKIINGVKEITPLGKTPLARSATIAINSLKENKTKATIILITDGIESCDGDICDVVSKAKLEGIEFKLHIVGFGLKEGEKEQLKCAANAGDGSYHDAANASGLQEVLTEATSQTVDDPKGNFSIYATKNEQPVDAWVRAYKKGTKEEVDAGRTYRDTSFLYLPPGKYDLQIQPLENTRIKGTSLTVESIEGRVGHETVSFDGGKINIITLNNGEGWDCTSKIMTKSGEVVGGSRTYGRPKIVEVNAGVYDIELVALRIKGLHTTFKIEDVEVQSGKTVEAKHQFKSGIALIGASGGGALVDATVNIKDKNANKGVTGGRTYTSSNNNPKEFILNPGVYEVTLKALTEGFRGKSETFTMEIKQGETFTKTINF
ncbi:VWA domain-containing protein [Tamlana crocina]